MEPEKYPAVMRQESTDITTVMAALANLSASEGLHWIAANFPGAVVCSTSFGMEDQILTHLIATDKLDISLFTLDTGRLFAETYALWTATIERYRLPIRTYLPDGEQLAALVEVKGPNCFYNSVENRKACCHIRKVEPLQRALKGKKVWVTGMRAAQSADRKQLSVLEWDVVHEIIKYHPLLQWTHEAVSDFVASHEVPVNPLHAKGFVSIGCAPCTRAIRPGEDFRAGRWWWEDQTKKECGLHVQHP